VINLNASSPAAIASAANVIWQSDSSGNVSAYTSAPYVSTAYDTVSTSSNIGTSAAPVTLLATPINAGVYRIEAYMVVTSVGSASSTMPALHLMYTDKDNVTAQDVTVIATNSGNTLTTVASGTFDFNVNTGVAIQFYTAGYASVAAGMTYSVHIRLVYLLS
jgi:hypothetical protein